MILPQATANADDRKHNIRLLAASALIEFVRSERQKYQAESQGVTRITRDADARAALERIFAAAVEFDNVAQSNGDSK